MKFENGEPANSAVDSCDRTSFLLEPSSRLLLANYRQLFLPIWASSVQCSTQQLLADQQLQPIRLAILDRPPRDLTFK